MNMIQDMIDVGFEVFSIMESVVELEKFYLYSVSIYGSDFDESSFGVFFNGRTDSHLAIVQFVTKVDPRSYGDDYRILNKEEIETLNTLLKAIEL